MVDQIPVRMRLLFVALLAIVPVGFLHAQASESMDARFVGTWRLLSWENQLDDGSITRDQRTVGYIMYSESGHMCWASMDPSRPEWADGNSPTSEEAISAVMGFAAYCARVEVNAKEGYVVHHVEVERVPNAVGIMRKRIFEFVDPDRLVMRMEPDSLPPQVVGLELTFQRVTE